MEERESADRKGRVNARKRKPLRDGATLDGGELALPKPSKVSKSPFTPMASLGPKDSFRLFFT